MNNQIQQLSHKYIVQVFQVGCGDNERDTSYILKTEFDLDMYHEKAKSVIALMAVANQYPDYSTGFMINNVQVEKAGFQELLDCNNVKIFCERYSEFTHIKKVESISDTDLAIIEDKTTIKTITLSLEQERDIQAFQDSILSNADCLGFGLEFFSYMPQETHNIEYIGKNGADEDKFYFDVNAFFGYSKLIHIGNTQLKLICARGCYLSFLCTPDRLISVESDPQYHRDFNKVEWMILKPYSEDSVTNGGSLLYESNGELWALYPFIKDVGLTKKLQNMHHGFTRLEDSQTVQSLLTPEKAQAIFERSQPLIKEEMIQVREEAV